MDPLLVADADGVRTLTLNRPDALNALTVQLKVALLAALTEAAADAECRAIVLAGAGRAFCVGQDLREHHEALTTRADPFNTVDEHYGPLARVLATMPKPVVAAVHGMAAGAGASLACLADFRIGGPRAGFLMAFANVGLAGDTGISWSLPRLVGHAKATELLMLAEPVDAAEALRLGLLSQVADNPGTAAAELAQRLAAGPTIAYGQLKRELYEAESNGLDQALITEAAAQRTCANTNDHRNATAAFVAKQTPTFIGR